MFCNSTITDLFLFVFTQLILHYLLEERVVNPIAIKPFERFILQTKAMIKRVTATPIRWFGLQFTEASTEVVPLVLSDVTNLPIQEHDNPEKQKFRYIS